MARTPLMQALQRLASDHAEADARGISVEEVRREHQLRLSRRDLLKGAGAVAAGLAVSSPFALAGHLKNADAASAPRIGIVGAGIAGLNAALTLQDAGYASTVFEASSRIGGRMHSNTTTWANGQTSEWCGELIDSDHKTILGLAKRFGLPVVDLIAAQPKGSQDTYFFFGKYYLQKDADQDFLQIYPTLKQQLKLAPFPTIYNHYTDFGYQLDHTSLYDWIEKYVPGGHSSNMGQLLDVAYNEEYGRDTPEQSSLNLLYLLAYQPTPKHFSIYGTSDERYHIAGGNQQIPEAIANTLPAGSVKLNWKMTAIVTNSDKTVTLTFSTPGGTRQQTFDYVILAIPFSVLRTLDYSKAGFNNLKKTAITQLGYGTNSKLQLQFDSRYWNGKGAWPGISDGNIYTDVGFQNTWDVTRAQPGQTGIIVDFTGGTIGASFKPNGPYTATPDPKVEHYANAFVKQLEEVWPGATQHYTGTATLSYPTGDPNLLGSYSCWLVGQYTLFSGYERVQQGHTHFAGEHCSISFQGFMEGGAQTGARAANEILKVL
ncbi:MAG TPA: NAD(P)/FAD-dependent oxidoreductase [Ktedonobacteraceae bacterium]|nr:NAD(P)/FAD-dependent oxidoreductase [Ktedonobacteraceae bacterium]